MDGWIDRSTQQRDEKGLRMSDAIFLAQTDKPLLAFPSSPTLKTQSIAAL